MTDPKPDIRPDVPHGARIWNYWSGGKDNHAADREVGEAVRAAYPEMYVAGADQVRSVITSVLDAVPSGSYLAGGGPEVVEVGEVQPIDAYGGVARKP